LSTHGSALAEGFYWYGEKLLWGYEDIEPDAAEALRFFRQAAELGFSDAYIRIGELYQHGKGVERDVRAALVNFERAAKAGNFLGIAYLAILVGRSRRADRADALWDRFFAAFDVASSWPFAAASVGEILHRYIEEQLRLGAEPKHVDTLKRHRIDVMAHHQNVLEHARGEDRLMRLGAVSAWISSAM
jgi:TPR repeat protein